MGRHPLQQRHLALGEVHEAPETEQPVHAERERQGQGVSGMPVRMRFEQRECAGGVALRGPGHDLDMGLLARRRGARQGACALHGDAGVFGTALEEQGPGLHAVREREVGIGGEGGVDAPGRPGLGRERQVERLDIGLGRGLGSDRERLVEPVRDHAGGGNRSGNAPGEAGVREVVPEGLG